ncbi:hypothetical protein Vretifemale_13547, partial [Volvox reticuliferus]
ALRAAGSGHCIASSVATKRHSTTCQKSSQIEAILRPDIAQSLTRRSSSLRRTKQRKTLVLGSSLCGLPPFVILCRFSGRLPCTSRGFSRQHALTSSSKCCHYTSVAALSTRLSTAALDKHPQSKERGITLDLGFSAFTVGNLVHDALAILQADLFVCPYVKLPMPEHMAHLPYDELQFTLVDCPGHASLIRTIIGGIQIIDMMVLVIDITKGLQTQTAECLVVGEVATSRMVVALNKIDQLYPVDEREKGVRRAIKRLGQTFAMTKFAGVNMVPVSAKPDGKAENPPLGIADLKAALVAMVPPVPRVITSPFLFAIDHCFPIKGQGSVLTGTVLQGSISVNEVLELPALKETRSVKSIQMFKAPVQRAVQGDRVGICVTQLDAGLLERGLACTPGTVPTFKGAVAAVEKIRFYAGWQR